MVSTNTTTSKDAIVDQDMFHNSMSEEDPGDKNSLAKLFRQKYHHLYICICTDDDTFIEKLLPKNFLTCFYTFNL